MRTRNKVGIALLFGVLLVGAGLWYAAYRYEPGADSAFDTSVREPALAVSNPRVLFDHGHRNVHSIHGRYGPFAALVRADGCRATQSSGDLTPERLAGADVLVIVNARGPRQDGGLPAFTGAECDAVERWVNEGGSLLLVADHHPCGPAAAEMAARFGVVMCGGWTDDAANSRQGSGDPGQLLFASAKGTLGDHAITRGRNETERVTVVETFTGQSLVPPPGAAVLMSLAESAMDRIPRSSKSKTKGGVTTTTFETDDRSAAGHSQGLALRHGKGRVVVLAEAAMLTAQEDNGHKFGMNAPGNDNRQFTLNTVRWLAGALGE